MNGRVVFVFASVFCACASFEESAVRPAEDGGTEAAAGDGGGSVDSAAASFCANNRATFCEDFDDPRSGVFPTLEVSDGGTVEIVDSPHVSPPRALRVRLPKPTAAGCTQGTRAITGIRTPAPNGFSVEYKFRVETHGGVSDFGVSVKMADVNGAVCEYYLKVLTGGLAYAVGRTGPDGGNDSESPLGRKALVGEWTSVLVDVHGVAGFRKLTVTVGGVVAITDAPVPGECQNGNYLAAVSVGAACLRPTATEDLDVSFDDVRVIAR